MAKVKFKCTNISGPDGNGAYSIHMESPVTGSTKGLIEGREYYLDISEAEPTEEKLAEDQEGLVRPRVNLPRM